MSPIDHTQAALPKPGGTVRFTPHKYRGHKRKVWERQGYGCAMCFKGIALEEMELHHESREGFAGKISHGRGLGGGKRNDIETVGLCGFCHQREEEKKR